MAKRTGVRPVGAKRGEAAQAPDRGDFVWLTFTPQSGREQAGRRPALVISPRSYNDKVGLCLACPITSHAKGYPFEVRIPNDQAVQGVVLADHVKSLDWRERGCEIVAAAPAEVLDELLAKLKSLIEP